MTADNLRFLRANRWLIALITTVCVASAIAASLAQTPVYQSQASLSYRDVSQDLGALGVAIAQQQTPAELAAGGAQTATDAEVAAAVKTRLNSSKSLRDLSAAVEATVDDTSNFVRLTAESTSATDAARLANAFALEAAAVTTEQTRERFRRAAAQVGKKVAATRKLSSNAGALLALQERQSNLETLATLAEPVRVAERAQVPDSPSSPMTAFNAALGLVLGLILAVAVALARSSFDKRMKDAREVELELGMPMIGKIRSAALGRSPTAMNGREPLSVLDLEALRILRRNIGFLKPDSPMKLVAVTSPLPAEGKSTVAIALAYLAALAGQRTLLVETDLRRPVFAERLGLPAVPGLTDYLAGEATGEAITHSVEVPTPEAPAGPRGAPSLERPLPTQLTCVPAGSPIAQTGEVLGSARFKAFLEQATAGAEFVVLDTSPLLPVVDTLELLPMVDGVLLCVRLDQTTRDQAAAVKAIFERLPDKPTGIVVTGFPDAGDDYGSYTYQAGVVEESR
ncbi:MAG: GNVR domain-containing protein [Thermoleophilaceae bacterium]